MTFEETRAILKIVKAEWPQSFRGMSREDAESRLNLWAEMFADDDAGFVGAAVKSLIVEGNREFAPNVGVIKAEMKKIYPNYGRDLWMRDYADDDNCPLGMERLGEHSRQQRLALESGERLALEEKNDWR